MATRAKRSDTRILTRKQIECIAMLAQGEITERQILQTLGINHQTIKKWKANPLFMERVVEMQNRLSNQALDYAVENAKKVKRKIDRKVDPKIKKRAIADFNFFRREFLGRKDVSCQKRWGKWFQEEDRTLLLCPRSHGKTTTVIDYLIWLIVRDRTTRILLLSKNSKLAARWVRSIKAILEGKGKYAKLVQYFGEFKPPGKPDKWTQEELVVLGADPEEPHPTISCFGITAALYGLRADIILCDDIVDNENAGSEEQREKLKDVFFSAVENILDATSGREPKMIVIGTRKHPLDLYNDLIGLEGFEHHVENAVKDWDRGRILAPELFNISFFRGKLNKLGLKKFNREFQNAAFDERDVIVPSDSFDHGLNMDEGRSFGQTYPRWYVMIGVDPGTSLRTKGTFGCVVEAIDPEQPEKRYLIDFIDEDIPSEEQPRYICALYQEYSASAVRIESNACQKYLMDSVLREAQLGGVYRGIQWPAFRPNVQPHFTSSTKLNDPIAGLETVGHSFEQCRWMIPCATEKDQQKAQEFIDKIVGYTYKEHKKAHLLMCLWFNENQILDRLNKGLEVIMLETPDYRAVEPQFIDIRRVS